PLPAELRAHHTHPGDVAARAREAGDESGLDRIGGEARQDDGDRAGGLFGRKARWRTGRNDELHLQVDQLGGELGKPIVAVVREAVLDDDVLALDAPVVAQPLEKSIDQERPAVARATGQKTDPVDFRGWWRLLAARQEADTDQGQAALEEL